MQSSGSEQQSSRALPPLANGARGLEHANVLLQLGQHLKALQKLQKQAASAASVRKLQHEGARLC